MKKRIRINYIHTAALRRASHVFWKEDPLLFDLAQSKLPGLRSESNTGLDT